MWGKRLRVATLIQLRTLWGETERGRPPPRPVGYTSGGSFHQAFSYETSMQRFAPETREMATLEAFHQRAREARATRDWSAVEVMLDEHVVVRTQEGERHGRAAALDLVRRMAEERSRVAIVGPRGGLISVLVSPRQATRRIEYEQTYRLENDKINEIIDLGRTPDQVYRQRSQPN